jgi:hypothetical protein
MAFALGDAAIAAYVVSLGLVRASIHVWKNDVDPACMTGAFDM